MSDNTKNHEQDLEIQRLDYTMQNGFRSINDRIGTIDDKLSIQELKIDKVLHVITGNEREGLATKISNNEKSLSRAWKWLFAVSVAILSLAFSLIQSGVTKAVGK